MHVVAYQIAPYQNGMVTIMIPQIRFSDRPLTECPVLDVWNYEDYEGIFHHFVAWELTVIDRYGMAMRYRQAQKIDKELYECLQTRTTVHVRYAPDQPDTSMLDEQWVTAIKGASST